MNRGEWKVRVRDSGNVLRLICAACAYNFVVKHYIYFNTFALQLEMRWCSVCVCVLGNWLLFYWLRGRESACTNLCCSTVSYDVLWSIVGVSTAAAAAAEAAKKNFCFYTPVSIFSREYTKLISIANFAMFRLLLDFVFLCACAYEVLSQLWWFWLHSHFSRVTFHNKIPTMENSNYFVCWVGSEYETNMP